MELCCIMDPVRYGVVYLHKKRWCEGEKKGPVCPGHDPHYNEGPQVSHPPCPCSPLKCCPH